MLTMFVRALALYVLVILLMRLMGKRQIGQLQPFELVFTVIIADLAEGHLTAIFGQPRPCRTWASRCSTACCRWRH